MKEDFLVTLSQFVYSIVNSSMGKLESFQMNSYTLEFYPQTQ